MTITSLESEVDVYCIKNIIKFTTIKLDEVQIEHILGDIISDLHNMH